MGISTWSSTTNVVIGLMAFCALLLFGIWFIIFTRFRPWTRNPGGPGDPTATPPVPATPATREWHIGFRHWTTVIGFLAIVGGLGMAYFYLSSTPSILKDEEKTEFVKKAAWFWVRSVPASEYELAPLELSKLKQQVEETHGIRMKTFDLQRVDFRISSSILPMKWPTKFFALEVEYYGQAILDITPAVHPYKSYRTVTYFTSEELQTFLQRFLEGLPVEQELREVSPKEILGHLKVRPTSSSPTK